MAATLAAAAGLLYGQDMARWDWQPALAWSQPWRAWTAAGMHLSLRHLLMNLAGCALIGLLGGRAPLLPRDALAWCLAWPLCQWGLLLRPDLAHYAGLSGVLHAGAAIIAWRLLRSGQGRHQAVGGLLAAGLVFKLWTEQPFGAVVQDVPGWDFALAPWSHLSGVLAGLLMAALLNALALRRRPRPRPEPTDHD
jgi:rhomboid family GlyGly-CTERM serine protease